MRTLVWLLSVFVTQALAPRQVPFVTPLAPAAGEKPKTTIEILHARVARADR
jgi:hypothetical protein